MKYFTYLMVALAMLFTAVMPASAQNQFPDVDEDNQYGYCEIITLTSEGVIQGYPDGTFQPDADVKRADSAIMFNRALDLEAGDNNPFSDVNEGSYFYNDVLATHKQGIFQGNPQGLFLPNTELTREQMATLIIRAFELPEAQEEAPFSDRDNANSSHIKDVDALFESGITVGRPDGSFDPKDSVTRQEFAIFLTRALYQGGYIEENCLDDADAPSEVTSASVFMSSGTDVEGVVGEDADKRRQTVDFDMTDFSDDTVFTGGEISVTKDSTIYMLDMPYAHPDIPKQENLTEGVNDLTVAEVLAREEVSLAMLKDAFPDGLSLLGLLIDEKGQATEVNVNFNY
ncbi:S-layer homology domain-containing protein [Alkalicoccus halolimnae]|uniref:S-layer homology domain-containing protein n=1 Tax=Alkalicoccus halolimnae TaxID=1667239 RepID=A0A5C7FQM2_9BACI|nr:S-layer homology domain-containing protein [Alkalicoccus halolimnae]TXF86995.1 S-layer homology domain-containing protein [Alkalicoccus halolimnae]